MPLSSRAHGPRLGYDGAMRSLRRPALALAVVAMGCAGETASSSVRSTPTASVSASASASASAAPRASTSASAPVAPQRVVLHPSNESETVLLGVAALAYSGKLRDPELALLDPALRASYAQMRADEDDPASPSVVNDEGGLSYAPRGPIRAAVVFLHGHGGAFALPCWQIAHAVVVHGVATLCPALPAGAAWSDVDGRGVVERTIAKLRAAGVARVVLVGLSDGGIGASRLAAMMPGTFVGLAAISGIDPAAAAPTIPTLVFQGSRDVMMSASVAKTWATRAHAEYVEVDRGHFAMLLEPAVFGITIAGFVAGVAR